MACLLTWPIGCLVIPLPAAFIARLQVRVFFVFICRLFISRSCSETTTCDSLEISTFGPCFTDNWSSRSSGPRHPWSANSVRRGNQGWKGGLAAQRKQAVFEAAFACLDDESYGHLLPTSLGKRAQVCFHKLKAPQLNIHVHTPPADLAGCLLSVSDKGFWFTGQAKEEGMHSPCEFFGDYRLHGKAIFCHLRCPTQQPCLDV